MYILAHKYKHLQFIHKHMQLTHHTHTHAHITHTHTYTHTTYVPCYLVKLQKMLQYRTLFNNQGKHDHCISLLPNAMLLNQFHNSLPSHLLHMIVSCDPTRTQLQNQLPFTGNFTTYINILSSVKLFYFIRQLINAIIIHCLR